MTLWPPRRPEPARPPRNSIPRSQHRALTLSSHPKKSTPPLYWRDKRGRELDFVIPRNHDTVDAIESKWNPHAFEPDSLLAFRAIYPKGRNFLVCPGADPAHVRSSKGLKIHVVELGDIPVS